VRRSKKQDHSMPRWLRSLLTVMIVIVFSTAFYLFFVRPYAFRWHLHSNRAPYYTTLPHGYGVCGLDISHYQGDIKWDKMAKCRYEKIPVQFIFIKATEGNNLVDESFHRNMTYARKYGFVIGAYHYYQPQVDPKEQADFFIHTVQLRKGDLPPVLDVEKTGHLHKDIFQRDVKTWLTRVEAHYGIRPILYTSYKFKLDYLDDDFFDRYPYWIAHYYVTALAYKGKWNFWQYTDIGSVPGIKGDVDLNVFNGTIDELVGMFID
jgi:lysozyme